MYFLKNQLKLKSIVITADCKAAPEALQYFW